jgi:putative ABC transport system permease protein
MRVIDIAGFSWNALTRHRLRTALILLAMGIGVASIVILTSLGEGARRYVVNQFASLGTHLLIVLPGRSETAGAAPAMFIGDTPRDLTINDAVAVGRSRYIDDYAPLVIGAAQVSWKQRNREVPVLGSTRSLIDIRQWEMAQGSFLPAGDPERGTSVVVIGAKIRTELFGNERALGEWLRLGDRRFRVIGVLATEGRSIGMDVEELVIVPVASAMSLFNTPSLFRIFAQARSREVMEKAKDEIREIITARHQGEEDITVMTQDAVLSTFDRILRALTYTVGGIASISLVVAGILIMNIMLVSVSQRTSEIGLLKALGAPGKEIMHMFLAEAMILSIAGALLGIIVGQLGSWLIGRIYPALPVGAPAWAIIAAISVAIITGLLFGAIPARHAARLDAVDALARH